MLLATALASLLLTAPALAQDEEAPEFLLGDVGTRIDLPKGWNADEWSDWHFKAKTTDRAVLLSVWVTPVQQVVTAKNLELWHHTHKLYAKEYEGKDIVVDRSEIVPRGEFPVGRFEMHFGEGNKRIDLFGATLAVEGQNLHMFTLAAPRGKRRAKAQMNDIVNRLEIHDGPAELKWGAEVEAAGVKTKLPADWRPPLDRAEKDRVAATIEPLGIDSLTDCWTALKPRGPHKPDVLVGCQGGLWLGVVDEYSFADVDETVLRPTLFGKAEVPAAEQVQAGDRVGFLYAPKSGLYMGVAPYDQGLFRLWALSSTDEPDNPGLRTAVTETMSASTYSGAHPASIPDVLSYWVMYRPVSPQVLCPLFGLLGLFGGVVVIAVGAGAFGASRNKYEDLADADD